MATLQEFVQALDAVKQGNEFYARCPAHNDGTASLSLKEKDGRVLWHCHAGCDYDAVASALSDVGLWHSPRSTQRRPKRNEKHHKRRPVTPAKPASESAPPKFIAYYDYVDAEGSLRYQVIRTEPKGFRQRRPDGSGGWTWNIEGVEPLLYKLPEVIANEIVFIVEGEKDVESLRDNGFIATTNSAGAKGKWLADFDAIFSRKEVYVIPDKDRPGLERACRIIESLTGIAASVSLVDLPTKDISQWFSEGHSEVELVHILEGNNVNM
jgi:putative DNA primase/helicase